MRYIAALCIAALMLGGCATKTMVKTSIKTPSGYEWTQEISGKADAVIEAARTNFIGKMHVEPETGALDLELRSGQEAQGLQSSGVDLEALLGILQMIRTTP